MIAATDFYRTLLGWTGGVDTFDDGSSYAGLHNGEQPVAVIMPIRDEMGDMPPNWVLYFGVEDIDASVAKAQELGGTLLVGPMEHAGFWFAMIQDPQSAPFYLIKS